MRNLPPKAETATSLPQPGRILDLVDESAQVRTLVLDLHLQAEPGQFVMAWLPGVDEKPFSLVRAAPATLTIARVGPFTKEIFALDIGDRLWLRGPLGRPFIVPSPPSPATYPMTSGTSRDSRPAHPLLLIAGGYGAAPLHFLAERAIAAGWPLSVVLGARTATDIVFATRFAGLGAQVVVATEDGSLGQWSLATSAAERLLAQGDYQAIYACGPEPMLAAVETLARAHSIPAQLSYERPMRCGFGLCGSCARQGWLVCSDGPVKFISGGS